MICSSSLRPTLTATAVVVIELTYEAMQEVMQVVLNLVAEPTMELGVLLGLRTECLTSGVQILMLHYLKLLIGCSWSYAVLSPSLNNQPNKTEEASVEITVSIKVKADNKKRWRRILLFT